MMKVYNFRQVQFVPADLKTVWDFFSTPVNLSKITPPEMRFVIQHVTGGSKMYPGQLISYKVSPFPFMRVRWTTEIKNVSELKFFTDEQKSGPFNMWYHQHFFTPVEGGVEMVDEVSYAIPLGLLGRFANRLLVDRQVKNIFKFREKAVKEIFG